MPTSAETACALNRLAFQLRNLQARFGLPILEGSAYPDSYLALLRTIVPLRILDVSEASLLRLWTLEKKLLTLLHVDSAGSPSWFLDSCGQAFHRKRRLLVTNYDLGVDISSRPRCPSSLPAGKWAKTPSLAGKITSNSLQIFAGTSPPSYLRCAPQSPGRGACKTEKTSP